MATIDQELLEDMGFIRGTGEWGHEVWVYEGYFWVHFDETMTIQQQEKWPEADDTFYTSRGTQAEFFKRFLNTVRNELGGSY